MPIAIYPGSFDPIHNGHIDIASRVSSLFRELVVAIYDTPSKHLLFSTRERFEMAQAALSHLSNVRVVTYQGLTVDLARNLGAKTLVRGLRAISDYEYETQLALTNKTLVREIETVFLVTSLQYAYLSSTILKEVAALGGNIENWVPAAVHQALRTRFASAGSAAK